MVEPRRWTCRPEGSNWGDFGPDDELGRLNLITPERRRKAAQEVRVVVEPVSQTYPRKQFLSPFA